MRENNSDTPTSNRDNMDMQLSYKYNKNISNF